MHEVLVNRLGGLSLARKSVVRLTHRPDMTLDVDRGRKTTTQHNNNNLPSSKILISILHKKTLAQISNNNVKFERKKNG